MQTSNSGCQDIDPDIRPFLRQTLPTATRRIERLTARFITLRILFELSIIFLDIFLFVTHNTSRINFK